MVAVHVVLSTVAPLNHVEAEADTVVVVDEKLEHDPDAVFHKPVINAELVMLLPQPRE